MTENLTLDSRSADTPDKIVCFCQLIAPFNFQKIMCSSFWLIALKGPERRVKFDLPLCLRLQKKQNNAVIVVIIY